ncbi:hypothetical protein PRIPAC_93688, partial [Pristionchus pacificus]|uniref:Uncharacterized protein n=1 Tax=Pristionchus pacificus TaxID=54126 RepID=A0A2A6CI77_PRIPA
MTINILKHPLHASKRIFGFLEPETTVRMRKISKSVKEFVDEFTLKTQTPDVEHIILRGNNNQDRELIFIFSHWWYSRMWINYIRSILDKLAIKIFRLKEEPWLTNANLYFTAKSTGMLQFLEYLSPRICNINVDFIHLSSNDPDIIRVTGGFLSRRSVKTLRLGEMLSTKADLSNYVDLVKQVNPESFHYSLENQKLVKGRWAILTA